MVAEVYRVLTREQVSNGDMAPGEQRVHLAKWVEELGLSDADVDAGRAVVVRLGLYWLSTASGNRYGIFLVARLEPGTKVDVGNVIEFRVDANGHLVGQRIRAASLVDGNCFFVDAPPSLLDDLIGFLSLIGPRGAATLYCSGLEDEGWQPKTFWVRRPGAAPSTASASRAAAPSSAQRVLADPPPAPTAVRTATPLEIHALLLLFRRDSDNGLPFPFDLSVLVDGEKVAKLPSHHCEAVLLNPGEHDITAGFWLETIGGGTRRELKLIVQAGDRMVVEYTIDTTLRMGPFDQFSVEKREQFAQRAHAISTRAATPKDRCAIQHTPKVVGRAAAATSETPP